MTAAASPSARAAARPGRRQPTPSRRTSSREERADGEGVDRQGVSTEIDSSLTPVRTSTMRSASPAAIIPRRRAPASPAEGEHHQRPHQVEVLLDRQRPEVAHVRQQDQERSRRCRSWWCRSRARPGARAPLEQRRGRGSAGTGPEQRRQHPVIEREDAERAAGVEVAEVVRLALGLEQQAGDEEAGEDEEEVHARVPGARRFTTARWRAVAGARRRRSGPPSP